MSASEQAARDRIRRFEADVLVHLDDLYRVARNAAEAEDLTQDTCLRAFERLDQLRSPAAGRVWAFSILRSIFLRRVERRARSAGADIIDSSLLEAGEVLQDTYEALVRWEEKQADRLYAAASGGDEEALVEFALICIKGARSRPAGAALPVRFAARSLAAPASRRRRRHRSGAS
jgi:DNA-directed RNA polymerase specialized sigma24 family protein